MRLSRSVEMVSRCRLVPSSALEVLCTRLVQCLSLSRVVCASWLKVVLEQTRASRRCTWTKLPSTCRSLLAMRWLVLKCITTWGSGGRDEWGCPSWGNSVVPSGLRRCAWSALMRSITRDTSRCAGCLNLSYLLIMLNRSFFLLIL